MFCSYTYVVKFGSVLRTVVGVSWPSAHCTLQLVLQIVGGVLHKPQCTPPLLAPPHLMQTAKPMDARKHSDLIYLDGPLTADAILKCIQQRFLEQKSVVRVVKP